VLGWRLLQPHTHGLAMMRQLGPDGFALNKNRWIDKREALQHWRKAWADHVNAALKRGRAVGTGRSPHAACAGHRPEAAARPSHCRRLH
jgi:hypothetical protein